MREIFTLDLSRGLLSLLSTGITLRDQAKQRHSLRNFEGDQVVSSWALTKYGIESKHYVHDHTCAPELTYYVYIYIYICTHVIMYIYIYQCICIYIHTLYVCKNIHIELYIHTYIYILYLHDILIPTWCFTL